MPPIQHHLGIVFCIHQNSKAILEVDDVEQLVRYDEAVAGPKSVRDIAGEVQPLLNEDEGICTVLFCNLNLLQNEFQVAVGVHLHFVRVIFTCGPGRALFQRLAEFMLTQSMGGGAFRCGLRGLVGELSLQIGGGVAVHPTVSR